jgi:hypothetical protein
VKLVELVNYLINVNILNILYQKQELNNDSEVLLIYMKDALDIESETILFEIEETEDDLIFEKEGVRYIQLFHLDHAIDLIEFDLNLKNKGFSNLEIAQKLLQYREKDA